MKLIVASVICLAASVQNYSFAEETQLSPLVVEAASPDDPVVPAKKLMPSALGLDIPVQNIPRSVTILSDIQLSDANVQKSEGQFRAVL